MRSSWKTSGSGFSRGRGQCRGSSNVGKGQAADHGVSIGVVNGPVVDTGLGFEKELSSLFDGFGVVARGVARGLGSRGQLGPYRPQTSLGESVGGARHQVVERAEQSMGVSVVGEMPGGVAIAAIDRPVLVAECRSDQAHETSYLLASLPAVVDGGDGAACIQIGKAGQRLRCLLMGDETDGAGQRLRRLDSVDHPSIVTSDPAVIESGTGFGSRRISEVDPWVRVVGQTDALSRLEQAADNPVHAYLLLGRRGYGTHQAALGFAGLILAASVDGGGDAARGRALQLALSAGHPDLVVVRPEGAALRVSEADEIIMAGLRTPLEGSRKVIIVDGIDLIQTEAIGKLLKVVEEPPPSTVFVLLADTVPPEIVTIASRCVTVEFAPLSLPAVEAALLDEGADPQRASVAAIAAGGDMDRARLLVSDDALADRADLWQSIPDRLDGSGSRACELVDQVRAGMDAAVGPLGGPTRSGDRGAGGPRRTPRRTGIGTGGNGGATQTGDPAASHRRVGLRVRCPRPRLS